MLTSDERELVLAKAIIIMMHMRNKNIAKNKTTLLALKLLVRISEQEVITDEELAQELAFLEIELERDT